MFCVTSGRSWKSWIKPGDVFSTHWARLTRPFIPFFRSSTASAYVSLALFSQCTGQTAQSSVIVLSDILAVVRLMSDYACFCSCFVRYLLMQPHLCPGICMSIHHNTISPVLNPLLHILFVPTLPIHKSITVRPHSTRPQHPTGTFLMSRPKRVIDRPRSIRLSRKVSPKTWF